MNRPYCLNICGLVHSPDLARDLTAEFSQDPQNYQWINFPEIANFSYYLDQHRHQIDCLIVEWQPGLGDLFTYLHHSATVLPTVLIGPDSELSPQDPPHYHAAEIILNQASPEQMPAILDHAITHFLKLAQACPLPLPPNLDPSPETLQNHSSRQNILSERLKERLGYLGVYYKRDTQQFFRHMPATRKAQFVAELQADYRQIILEYFHHNSNVNNLMDAFVTKAFFADISVSQILEIHIELMDNFAKQLKLEGRNEDILLDYRLTLIDVIAHLCEMYRRSIPREA